MKESLYSCLEAQVSRGIRHLEFCPISSYQLILAVESKRRCIVGGLINTHSETSEYISSCTMSCLDQTDH